MDFEKVLELPLKTFTLYNQNIDRLRAEQDMRTLKLLISHTTTDHVKSCVQDLTQELDSPAIFTPKMDKDAFERLKALQGIVNGSNRTPSS